LTEEPKQKKVYRGGSKLRRERMTEKGQKMGAVY